MSIRKSLVRGWPALGGVAAALSAPAVAAAGVSPGDLVTSWADGGIVRVAVPGSVTAGVTQVLTAPDGRVVALGPSHDLVDFQAFMRPLIGSLGADGQPDPVWAEPVVTPSFGSDGDRAFAGTLDSQGRVTFAGSTSLQTTLATGVGRLRPDGTLDPSFDVDGVKTVDVLDDSYDDAGAAAALPGGRTALAVRAADQLAIVVLGPDGAPDPGFGDGGIRHYANIPANHHADVAMVTTPDGDLVVAPGSSAGVQAFKVSGTTGDPDAAFGVDGVATALPGKVTQGVGLAMDADGNVLVATSVIDDGIGALVTRFTAAGVPDAGFGADGTRELPEPAGLPGEPVQDILLAPDGTLFVAGAYRDPNQIDVHAAVWRLAPGGAPVADWGAGGAPTLPLGTGEDKATTLALAPNGDLLVGGTDDRGEPSNAGFVLRLHTTALEGHDPTPEPEPVPEAPVPAAPAIQVPVAPTPAPPVTTKRPAPKTRLSALLRVGRVALTKVKANRRLSFKVKTNKKAKVVATVRRVRGGAAITLGRANRGSVGTNYATITYRFSRVAAERLRRGDRLRLRVTATTAGGERYAGPAVTVRLR